MSSYRIVVKLDTDDDDAAARSARLIKQALAPLGAIETFTFDEAQFCAHWRPFQEPHNDQPRHGFEAEHTQARTSGARRRT